MKRLAAKKPPVYMARRHAVMESSETQARRAAGWWTGRTKHSMIVEAIIATIAAEREARPAGAEPFHYKSWIAGGATATI